MLTELRDGVWWFECTGVNAYLVADGDGLTLVDTGTPFDAATVEAAVESAGFDLSNVERILITHYDFDHVGSVAKLAVDAPVYIGRADAPLLTGEQRPPLSGAKPLLQLVTSPLIPEVSNERVRRVDDGDEIGGFTAYHAPGHTPGHTVYVHEAREAAFLGDLVIEREGELQPSPWFISYDTDDVHRSIEEVVARAPDIEVAAMGHGMPFRTGGGDRLRTLAESR
ncbi:MAG: glyoxylase-like metal-dependent hydrolase (beta-lactamase superfamily II) [Natronomonas sp.]|jgi:glyoxylase-like metal-dependent hydrolase (beta-lactamase superfamily II)|uniref:MBL fold metallo-hydrolase n=1 Tax=Natronomonas sp. TaxID=2184060 RepID=UPI0039899812